MSIMYKSKTFESNARELRNIYVYLHVHTLNYYRMIDTIITLSLNHKQSSLESFDQKTLKSQCLNSWPGSLFATITHWNILVLHLSAFIAVFVWQDFQTNVCFLMETTILLCYCQKIQTPITISKLISP